MMSHIAENLNWLAYSIDCFSEHLQLVDDRLQVQRKKPWDPARINIDTTPMRIYAVFSSFHFFRK